MAGSSLWGHIKSETQGREEGTWLHPPADNRAGPGHSRRSWRERGSLRLGGRWWQGHCQPPLITPVPMYQPRSVPCLLLHPGTSPSLLSFDAPQ